MFIGVGVNAQVIPVANSAHHASGWIVVSYDDFDSRTQYAPLDGQGVWEVIQGSITVQGDPDRYVVSETSSTWCIAVYDTTYNDDQGSEILCEPK